MFFGEYEHQLDNKNRIRIPAKFRKDLGSSYVVGKSSIPNAVAVYPLDAFNEISKKRHSPFNIKAEIAHTMFFGAYFTVEEDPQGRLLLSEQIRKLGNLDKDLISIGAGDHINMMSKSTYDDLQKTMSFEDALSLLDSEYNCEQ